jgi:hypothetical protein
VRQMLPLPYDMLCDQEIRSQERVQSHKRQEEAVADSVQGPAKNITPTVNRKARRGKSVLSPDSKENKAYLLERRMTLPADDCTGRLLGCVEAAALLQEYYQLFVTPQAQAGASRSRRFVENSHGLTSTQAVQAMLRWAWQLRSQNACQRCSSENILTDDPASSWRARRCRGAAVVVVEVVLERRNSK